MPTPGAYQLSAQALSQMQADLAQNNYAAAYRVVLADLKNQVANGAIIDKDTMTWYTDAPEINDANSTAAIHYFARDYVSDYVELKNKLTVSDAEFQDASNALAKKVLQNISDTEGEVQPFSKVGVDDTQNTAQQFGAGIYAWPAYAELAAVSDPNFQNHSFLEGLKTQDQIDILNTTNKAGMQTLSQLLNNGQASDALHFISASDELFIQQRLPTLLDQLFYEGLLSPATEPQSLLELNNSSVGKTALTLDTMAASYTSNTLSTTQQNNFLQTLHSLEDQTTGYYVVKAGDVWANIASSYGMSATTLQAINADSSSELDAGTVIRVPISQTTGLPSSTTPNALANQAGIYDITTGKWIITGSESGEFNNGSVSVIDDSGNHLGEFTTAPGSFAISGGNLLGTIDSAGDKIVFAPDDTASLQTASGHTLVNYGVGQLWSVTPTSSGSAVIDTLLSSTITGNLLGSYSLNAATGTIASLGVEFDGSTDASATIAQYAASPYSLLTTANNVIGLDAAGAGITNTYIPTLVVVQTGAYNSSLASAETSNNVAGGEIMGGGDFAVVDPYVNLNGLFNNSPAGVLSGNYQPGQESLLPPEQDVAALLGPAAAGVDPTPVAAASYGAAMGDYANSAPSLSDIDPLVIDLSGQGIRLTNWIDNTVYFDTNVTSSGLADGKLHHTSWVQSGTGILALDRNGNGKIDDITETLSQFFGGGPTPGAYKDGLAALASLAQAGATSFTAATALIDPVTHVSYFNEIKVWQDSNLNGATDSGELQTLSQLGITAISLTGSGNLGESIAGSAVTNRTSYTKSDGSVGQVAAVNFQTNSVGDVTVAADGGVVINSTSEGGVSATNSFVDKNASAHSFSLSHGTLTDATSAAIVGTNMVGMFATTQNDQITVDASDTGSYWLGGGTGAATLTGGAGNTMFLINAHTVVHGGSGFNIAQVTGSSPIAVDLAADRLQEVIGGAGNGVFNASGTTWNAFIQGGSGNNIIIGGAANDALAGGTGDDLIEAGTGGSVIHAGSGNDVIYGGSGSVNSLSAANINAGSDSIAGFIERMFNGMLGREPTDSEFQAGLTNLTNGTYTKTTYAQLFAVAPERNYGAQDNTQFTNNIFQQLLGQPPSSTELANFVAALNSGVSRGVAIETVADSAYALGYWASLHAGASDVIYGGAGQDTVFLGSNNAEIFAGTGAMNVLGNGGFSVMSFHGSYADYSVAHNADGSITVTDKNPNQDGPVTLKGVSVFDFADVQQIPIDSNTGLPVNDTVAISGSGPYTILSSALLANDQNYAGAALSISNLLDNNGNAINAGGSGQVNGGTASLSADASTIIFTPTPGFTGLPSFRYNLVGGTTVQQTSTGGASTGATAAMSATVTLLAANQPADAGFPQEWYMQAANVLPVWQAGYTGAGVSVGVFDPSGNVDFNNPDLAANGGGEFKDDGTPGIQKIGTHATLVAGVIGAARDGEGQVGVAYNATLSSEAVGDGSAVDPNTGFGELADWSKYAVVNNSWGETVPFTDTFLYSPLYAGYFQSAAQNGRGGLGTVIVFSAGNERAGGGNTEQFNGTANQYVITVGGINAPSDLGALKVSGVPFSSPGASVLVSAPANNISTTSTILTNQYGQQFGGSSEIADGTSLAAPIVSGVAALMLQANPNLGARDIQEILADTATLVPDPNTSWSYNTAKSWNGGGMHESYDYGFGEVDAAAAVRLAKSWTQNDTFQHEQQIILSQSPNLAIPVSGGGSTPFVDFNLSSVTPIVAEHIDVTLKIVFANLAISASATQAQQQQQLDAANALIDKMSVTLSPSNGAASVLMSPVSGGDGAAMVVSGSQMMPVFYDTFDTVRNWNESSAQDYHVSVTYPAGTTPAGVIQSAQLTVYGDSAVPHIYTDEFGAVGNDPNNAARSILSDSGSNVVLNAAAVSTNIVLNLNPGSTDSVIAGRALTIAGNTTVTTAYGGAGNDTIVGNNAGDALFGGQGNDTIRGGSGNDTISGGGGTDSLDGGGGTNTVSYVWSSAKMTADLTIGKDSTGSTLANFQNITASNNGDTLIVGNGVHKLIGGSGDDMFRVGTLAAGSVIQGGGGTDTILITNGDISQASISGIHLLQVTGGAIFSAAQINIATNGMGQAYTLTVSDTAANVVANLAALQSLAAIGKLTSVKLTDGTTPTLILTASQVAADSAALAKIAGYYNLSVSGGTIALADNAHVDIIGSNNHITPGLNDNFGVLGSNNVIQVTSSLALTSAHGIADRLAALGSNAVIGDANNNSLTPGAGTTVMVGGAGNDSFIAPGLTNGGTVTVWGGTTTGASGIDTVDYSSATTALQFNLGQSSGPGGGVGWVASGSAYLASLNGISNAIGGSGNDTFTANSGSDVLTGGAGSNTYIFGPNFGQDTINNLSSTSTTPGGKVNFGSGATDEKLWFQKSGNNLLVDLLGTSDSITVSNWYGSNAGAQLAGFNTSDGLKLDSQIAQLVSAMAGYGAAHPGFNPASATQMPNDTALQAAITAAWHH